MANQTARKELLAQLQHLRTESKEIGRLYIANLQRDIVQLIDFLNEKQPPAAALTQMKERVENIRLKPEKGRRKDLRRIEDAVRSMRKIVFAGAKDE